MTKQCAKPDCNREIEQWKTYCDEHYLEMTTQQNNLSQQYSRQQPQTVQQMPTNIKYEQPPNIPQTMMLQQQKQELPKSPTEINGKEERQVLKINGEQKIRVREVAFNGAIKLMSHMDFEDKDFQTMIGEVETLTNSFQDIIITDYES